MHHAEELKVNIIRTKQKKTAAPSSQTTKFVQKLIETNVNKTYLVKDNQYRNLQFSFMCCIYLEKQSVAYKNTEVSRMSNLKKMQSCSSKIPLSFVKNATLFNFV